MPPPTRTTTEPRKGRGMVIAGCVLIALSVIGGIIGTTLTVGGFNFDSFERDVVIAGPETALIPGSVDFSVEEPLDPDAAGAMTVGIATTTDTVGIPDCTLETADGQSITLLDPGFDATLLRDSAGLYEVVGSVQLEPGDYRASCDYVGEPSQSQGGNFTVGRTFGSDDFDEFVGPVFGFLGVIAICGLLFVIGIVLLIVGLVRGSRSRGQPPGPYGGQPPYGQPPYGQPPYGQPPYGQPPYGQGPHGQQPGVPPPAAPAPGPWTGPPPGAWPPAQPQPAPPSPPQGPPTAPPAAPPAGPDGGWPGPPN